MAFLRKKRARHRLKPWDHLVLTEPQLRRHDYTTADAQLTVVQIHKRWWWGRRLRFMKASSPPRHRSPHTPMWTRGDSMDIIYDWSGGDLLRTILRWTTPSAERRRLVMTAMVTASRLLRCQNARAHDQWLKRRREANEIRRDQGTRWWRWLHRNTARAFLLGEKDIYDYI